MNRSLLIVICDFIVSAMLSMLSGMPSEQAVASNGVPLDSHTAATVVEQLHQEQARLEAARQELLKKQFQSGFDAGQKEQLEELSRKLAEAAARAEMLERKLALTPENSGALSAAQLQKQLEKELTERHLLNIKQQDAQRQLAELRQLQKETGASLQDLRDAHAARGAQLKIAQNQAVQAGAELEKHRNLLASRSAELQQVNADVARLTRIQTQLTAQRTEAEAALAYTRGKLSATEQELAAAKGKYEQAQLRAESNELKLVQAERRIGNMQQMVNTAVKDLSRTETDLRKSRQEAQEKTKQLAITSEEVKQLRVRLADAEARLRSDVLKCYTNSVARLQLDFSEKRLLLTGKNEETFYLPVVKIGGKNCLVGDFLLLIGNMRIRNNFTNLTHFRYQTAPAEGEGKAVSLAGPLFAPKNEVRLGLLEVDLPDRKPLEVLSLSGLEKRGTQDLYLFKATAFGRESTLLDGRCSVDFTKGKEGLFIRNTVRGATNQLRAEPGDFVLTKQGEFVGAVVSVIKTDLGRKEEARCVLFPDHFQWENVHTVPVAKADNAAGIREFDTALQPILKEIRLLERQQGAK